MDTEIQNTLEKFLTICCEHQSSPKFLILLQLILENTIYCPKEFLSQGSYAKCYSCVDDNYVIKTNILSKSHQNDGSVFYIDYCVKNQHNKHVPQIVFHFTHGRYYFIICERLTPIKENNHTAILDIILHYLNQVDIKTIDDKIPSEYYSRINLKNNITKKFIKTYPSLIHIIKDSYDPILKLDLSIDSIMMRKNEIVLVDPYWFK